MRTHTDRELRMLVARSHGAPLHLPAAQLEMANLLHIDLRGAVLAGANLRGAMLWGALLDDACLAGADLTCANLTWSSLGGCSLQGALLVEADLDEATVDGLAGAITAGADMFTITFAARASMQPKREGFDEKALRQEMQEEARRIAASDAAVLERHRQSAPPSLRARGAAGFGRKSEQLELARTRVLSDSDLQELLRWSAATGKPLNLRGCNLSQAKLRNASLRGACLAFTDATGADTRGADLVGADLQNSCGWGERREEST